jgi:hypothetical protein
MVLPYTRMVLHILHSGAIQDGRSAAGPSAEADVNPKLAGRSKYAIVTDTLDCLHGSQLLTSRCQWLLAGGRRRNPEHNMPSMISEKLQGSQPLSTVPWFVQQC